MIVLVLLNTALSFDCNMNRNQYLLPKSMFSVCTKCSWNYDLSSPWIHILCIL